MEKKARLTVMFIMLLAASCGLDDLTGMRHEGEENRRVIRGFQMTSTEGENKAWKLSASRAEFLDGDEERQILAWDIEAEFYGEEESTLLSAPYGELDRDSQAIDTSGEVRIVSGSRVIDTRDVRWDPEKAVFETDAPALITTPGGQVRGTGMTASADLSDIRLREHISGEFGDR